ncbi:hypothetical protein TsFJ059_006410 [Trichoderma semiorbis]|uniref:Uncharacterized protein n=1 Tax=Trichoderma semiorbis TaxID=1491008 RepID=A0A9P8HEY9_9HYPO|nr:hypothetical protein TsFJ059_006410 [Trichoderma semiorbis]
MAVSSTSSLLLYAAAGFSAFTVAAHTQMGFDTGFVLMSIMAVKWARHGITGPYEKAFAAVYSASQVFFGACPPRMSR